METLRPVTPTRTLIDAALRETAAAVVGGAVAGYRPGPGMSVCNLHDLAEAANAVRGGMARSPDAIVITEEIHRSLTSGVQIASQGVAGAADLFRGVLVFRSADNKEALEKGEELRLGGRRVHCYIHAPKKVDELLAGPDEVVTARQFAEQTTQAIFIKSMPQMTEAQLVEAMGLDPAQVIREDADNGIARTHGRRSAVISGEDDAAGQEAQGGAGGVGEAVDHQLPGGERVRGHRDQQRGDEGGEPVREVQQDQRLQ